MFNFSIKIFPNGMCRAIYFNKHIVNHQPVKKCSKLHKCFIPTPFTEKNPDTHRPEVLYATNYEVCYDPSFQKEESLRCSVSRTRKRIREISCSGNFRYFCTFTFSPEWVNRYDFSDCSRTMQSFLRKLRSEFPDIQYIVVPELHKDGAFHFHGLFSAHLPVTYAGFFARSGGNVYHASTFQFGFTNCTIINDPCKTANYIVKYISKDLVSVSKGKRRYWYSHSTINVPESLNILLPGNLGEEIETFANYIGGCVTYDTTEGFPVKIITFPFDKVFYDDFLDWLDNYALGYESFCSDY